MRFRKRHPAMPASIMMAGLAWGILGDDHPPHLHDNLGTCTPAEYRRMVREKAAAALETGRLLSSPKGASAVALLRPWHSRATRNAKRLRRRAGTNELASWYA